MVPLSQTPAQRSESDAYELAETYLLELRSGVECSVEEFSDRYPGQRDTLRSILPVVLLAENLQKKHENALLSGSKLGVYTLNEFVGRGGMGVVYKATQPALRREVAIKVLVRASQRKAGFVSRLEREARAASRLHHPNIVPVFDFGMEAGTAYLAMPYIHGKTLDQLSYAATNADDAITGDWQRIANIGAQVASALAYAHDKGMVHRDVKPTNLILDSEGTVWVTDFGLAKDESDEFSISHTGDLIGTPRYIPPEQMRGISDPLNDIYSLGVTLYELATGERAWGSATPAEMLSLRATAELPPIEKLAPEIPKDLARIITKAAAQSPQERFQSATELQQALNRFAHGTRTTRERRTERIERRDVWWLGAMAASLVACATFFLLSGQPESTVPNEPTVNPLVSILESGEAMFESRLHAASTIFSEGHVDQASMAAINDFVHRTHEQGSLSQTLSVVQKLEKYDLYVLQPLIMACLASSDTETLKSTIEHLGPSIERSVLKTRLLEIAATSSETVIVDQIVQRVFPTLEVEELVSICDSDHYPVGVRTEALLLGHKRVGLPPALATSLYELLEAFQRERDDDIYVTNLRKLRVVKDEQIRKFLHQQIADFQGTSLLRREQCIYHLAQLDCTPETNQALLRVIQAEPSEKLVALAWKKWRSKASYEDYLELLGLVDLNRPRMRLHALSVLKANERGPYAQFHSLRFREKTLPIVVQWVRSEDDANIRAQLYELLGSINEPLVRQIMVTQSVRENDLVAREAVVASMRDQWYSPLVFVSLLRASIFEPNPEVRSTAIASLQRAAESIADFFEASIQPSQRPGPSSVKMRINTHSTPTGAKVRFTSFRKILRKNEHFGTSGHSPTLIHEFQDNALQDVLPKLNLLFLRSTRHLTRTEVEIEMIKQWVADGGILFCANESGACDVAKSFGVRRGGNAGDDWIIVDESHAIIDGPFGQVGTTGARLKTSGQELYFHPASIQPEDTVLAVDADSCLPTIIVRPFGNGHVVFSGDEGIFYADMTGGGKIGTSNDILAANFFAWAADFAGSSVAPMSDNQ